MVCAVYAGIWRECQFEGYGRGVGSRNCLYRTSDFNETGHLPAFLFTTASCSWALSCEDGAVPPHLGVFWDMLTLSVAHKYACVLVGHVRG